MYRPLDDGRCLRVVGIDPGTDHVGMSVLDYDLISDRIIAEDVFSLSGAYLMRFQDKGWEDVYGSMSARLRALSRALSEHFIEYEPHRIIVERPFYNRMRPSAYGPLIRSIAMVEEAVATYCPTMRLREIDPSSVKKNAGVKGNSGDKSAVNRTLIQGQFFDNPHDIDYASLNEHEADSLIIGYYGVCEVRSNHLRDK